MSYPTNIWLDKKEVMARPTTGRAWEKLESVAQAELGAPKLNDQDDRGPVRAMAAGLYYMRTGSDSARQAVEQFCIAAPGTELPGRTLALGRNLLPLLIAADSVGYRETEFLNWVANVRTDASFDGGPRTLIDCHELRPNNWGTHAGASRIGAAMYLRDFAGVRRAGEVWKSWMTGVGGRFEFGETSWQWDPDFPQGINAKGATKERHNIDGVLPDDQRRGGAFSWPPPHENYVWEALQGTAAACHMLYRAGETPWAWGSRAVFRALAWLYDVAEYEPEADDEGTPHIANYYLPKPRFDANVPAAYAKNVAAADWCFAGRRAP